MNFKTLELIFNQIVQTELILRLGEKVHQLTYKKSNGRMAQAMERFKKCENKKPKSQIKYEMDLCKNFWGCYPLHYYRYDLYRKDKELPESELLNYIPEFFFYALFLPYYDSKKYEILLTDKNISEQYFGSLDIKQPHTLCKLISNSVYTTGLIKTTFDQVKKEITEKEHRTLFVKPVEGQSGDGIYIFYKNDEEYYIAKTGDVLNQSFLRKIGAIGDYIIQAGLMQDEEISKIYPHSVNTFRIITENKNGNIRILHAILRMGRGENELDNIGQGGLFTNIDIKTGNIGDYAISDQCETFQKHPDTNFFFRNYKISQWNMVSDFVTESATKMLQFTYIAWDIALTNEGPLAIEANLKYGIDGWQLAEGGLREFYQISDPQFYWRNKGKRA